MQNKTDAETSAQDTDAVEHNAQDHSAAGTESTVTETVAPEAAADDSSTSDQAPAPEAKPPKAEHSNTAHRTSSQSQGKRSGGAGVAWLSLVLGVALAAGAYWGHQRLSQLEQAEQSAFQDRLEQLLAQQDQSLQQQASTLEQELAQLRTSVSEQVRQVGGQLAQARAAEQDLLAKVEGRMATVDSQQARIEALQSRLDALLERIDNLKRAQQPKVLLRWQAARDLLAVGRLQLVQLQQVTSAIEHYQAARSLLLEQADERSATVISVIDEELRRIQSIAVPDNSGYIDAIQQQLALLPQWIPATAAQPSEPTESAGWWDKLKFMGRQTFTVRRAEELDRTSVDVLQQALRLHLLAVQAALVVNDEAAVQRHTQHAADILARYGTGVDEQLQPVQTLLEDLQQEPFGMVLPAVGQAEERLQELLRAQRSEGGA
ncbi:MAG: hypothetical protein MI750_11630 [Xanthomonadales bacterium]|nr:hypothetical protein [Xanthomonadales bacterium]